MREAIWVAGVQLAIGVLAYAAARVYVALLLRLRHLPAWGRQAVGLVAYLTFIPFVCAPLFAIGENGEARRWMHSSTLPLLWSLTVYVLSVLPAIWYIRHTRLRELQEAGFFRS